MPEVQHDPTANVPAPVNPDPLLVGLKGIYRDWLAAYRGLVPHGINTPAPDSTPEYAHPDTYDDADYTVSLPDNNQPLDYRSLVAIPIVITDDLSTVRSQVQTSFTAYSEQIGAVSPIMAVGEHDSRISVRLSNIGPGIVYIGQNESVMRSGYPLVVNEAVTLTTTKGIWLVQQTAQATPALVGIIYEYDKEISG